MGSLGIWHRRTAGYYIRKRNGTYDSVRQIGNRKLWYVYIDNVPIGNAHRSRLEATSALDQHINSQFKIPETNSEEQDTKCDGCGGSGIWHGAGFMLNGVFQGPTGKCFRCNGKGSQTPEDRKRNQYYDNHVRKIEA
jgi:hypothetical protein